MSRTWRCSQETMGEVILMLTTSLTSGVHSFWYACLICAVTCMGVPLHLLCHGHDGTRDRD